MNVIIQYMGWLVGILLISIFGIIGYFADKKDRKNISNNTISDQPVNLNNSIANEPTKWVDDLNNNISNNNISNNSISSESIGNSFSDIPLPEFKNIEDTHMSLEDLENVNYNKIVNGISKLDELDSNNNIDNNLELDNSFIQNNNDSIYSLDTNFSESNINNSTFDSLGVSNDESNIAGSNSNTLDANSNELNNDLQENDDLVVTESDSHIFDNEISQDNSSSYTNDESNHFCENINNVNVDNSIPEIGSYNSDETDLYSDEIDDDIWKF